MRPAPQGCASPTLAAITVMTMWPVKILLEQPRAAALTRGGPVPARALLFSLAAMALPVLYEIAAPEDTLEYELLIWMTPLVPALVLSYYRGWRGAAGALAGGMAALSLAQAAALWLGKHLDSWALPGTLIVLYVGVTLGIGYASELLHRALAEAERLALIDELTGLPNRRYARLVLEKEFAAAQRGRGLAVAVFDLDDFKAYNDRYGHAAGDAALRAFARVLEANTRRMNLSCRYGGDEFLSVLADADVHGVRTVIDRVRAQLAATPLRGTGRLTVSAGAAVYGPGVTAAEDLVAAADDALYRAKGAGRDCVRTASAAAPVGAAGAAG